MPFWLNDLGIVSALGVGKSATLTALANQHKTPLTRTSELAFEQRSLFVGQVSAIPLSESARINQLIDLTLAEIAPTIAQLHTQSCRLAVVIGTSTASIHDGERARKQWCAEQSWSLNFHYEQQELIAPAQYIAKKLNANGPCYAISTACSSSAKALISAKALLAADLADVVICGGVDSLCQLTINGFDSLSSISDEICMPFSSLRSGINIGEGAALFVMSKEAVGDNKIALLGAGESSDAHHISAPEPDGKGAETAMKLALSDAGLNASDVDYINAHGTATVQNDAMEAKAIKRVFGSKVPVSSSKHLTGHTLGAAGAIEAGLCWLSLSTKNKANLVYNAGEQDSQLAAINILTRPIQQTVGCCLSNSFAFGGNNASIILGQINE